MGDKRLGVMALNDAKAGMKGLDKDRINKIIEEASKGSKYYEAQQKKQKRIDDRVEDMRKRLSSIKSFEPVDKLILELEKKRDLSRTIVHVDMDAYYVAVEMLGPPPLSSEIPLAVGSSGMLSTSNYAARKYGVRAGMPGFIGKKLCPHLKIVPPNFNKYTSMAQKIREVFARYDANFCPMSLDEAYLDITDYLKNNPMDPGKLVENLRQEIFEETGLTASAGIAPNTLLAKVASDQNKPNGQFHLEPDRDSIMDFVGRLPVRKVGGIGNVTSQLLAAIGINTCSDLFQKLSLVKVLFSEISFDNFAQIALGLGANTLSNERERKSMSNETTFRDTSDEAELLSICKELSNDLSNELSNSGLKGKCITLKIKTDTFVVRSKAISIKNYTNDPDQIASTAELCLRWFFRNIESKPLTLRLMGVRMSEFGNLGKSQPTLKTYLRPCNEKENELVGCPNCEDKILLPSINLHLDECLRLRSDQLSKDKSPPSTSKSTDSMDPYQDEVKDNSTYICPICSKSFSDESHIDDCLSKKAIAEILNKEKRVQTLEPTSHKIPHKKLKTIDSYFKT